MMFTNFYDCYRCRNHLANVWSCAADDDCPRCGARHVSPTRSEDADDEDDDEDDEDDAGLADASEPEPLSSIVDRVVARVVENARDASERVRLSPAGVVDDDGQLILL